MSKRESGVRHTEQYPNRGIMMRGMRNFVRAGVALAGVAGLMWFSACSDPPGGPCGSSCPPPPPEGVVVSDPIPAAALAAETRAALALAPGAQDDVTYVSLAPGTVPTGSRAIVRRVGDAASLTTAVTDGGFDPVPVVAQAGDSIEVRVTDDGGATLFEVRVAVAAARPPVVVRTEPPPRKRDVPLNATMVIVFSEPVDGGTLTPSSVQLLRGTTPVAGAVSLLQGTGAVAAFTPAALLAVNTDYQLVVTQAVRDLDGDALEASVTVEFTTGQSSTGPAASISVSPDTVAIIYTETGVTYQLTATVRDAAGNVLNDQPIIWSTSNPSRLTVSPTGLLTLLAAGSYQVSATVNGLTAWARVYVPTGPPASVVVSPTPASVGVGDTIILTATVRDADGYTNYETTVTWTSSAPAVATIAPTGSASSGLAFATVTGVSPGSVTITATSETVSGTAAVTVTPPQPIASVTVTPDSVALVLQGTRQLAATVRDANGKVLAGRTITWATDNEAVATVDASGVVTGVGVGSAAVTGTSEGVSDTTAILVTVLQLASVSTNSQFTCGLTPSGAGFCWGGNWIGQFGNGSTTPPFNPFPVAMGGGLTLTAITTGFEHACGLTTSGSAYCWGRNLEGQLGNGLDNSRDSVPVPVTGGRNFAVVSAGEAHTCGLTPGGAAYCWGYNGLGRLGTGSTSEDRARVPVAVTGGLAFSALSVGGRMTCGLTSSGAAYCWGEGELGNGSPNPSSVPVAVSGGLTFAAVSAGWGHSCGITNSGAAYCWGSNGVGQLGTGSTNNSSVPVAVTGGLTFTALSVGDGYACGLTTGGGAYCWGWNQSGNLGDGSTTNRLAPVPVAGGHPFTAIDAGAGYVHTCGVTAGGAAYCWGLGGAGQLGDGTSTTSYVPVKVAGQP